MRFYNDNKICKNCTILIYFRFINNFQNNTFLLIRNFEMSLPLKMKENKLFYDHFYSSLINYILFYRKNKHNVEKNKISIFRF